MLIHRLTRRLRDDERGFTLIETLVAILAGVIVTGALFAILEVSIHQFSRLTDYTEATQAGRSTMTHVVDELHSACSSSAYTPIKEKSNREKLVFVTAFSEKAELTGAAENASGARKVEVFWEQKPGKEWGKLVERTYLSTGGAAPNFAFSEKWNKEVVIGEKVLRGEIEDKGKVEKGIFAYYGFATEASTNTAGASSTLETTPLAGGLTVAGLTSTEAGETASVLVTFVALARDGSEVTGRTDKVSNQVTFALNAPNSEAKIDAAACE